MAVDHLRQAGASVRLSLGECRPVGVQPRGCHPLVPHPLDRRDLIGGRSRSRAAEGQSRSDGAGRALGVEPARAPGFRRTAVASPNRGGLLIVAWCRVAYAPRDDVLQPKPGELAHELDSVVFIFGREELSVTLQLVVVADKVLPEGGPVGWGVGRSQFPEVAERLNPGRAKLS